MSSERHHALIVAGGRGTRARTGSPKQYQPLGGVPLLRHTVAAFAHHPRIDAVTVVIGADDTALYTAAVAGLPNLTSPVIGGETRQISVANGLGALATRRPARVLIHDGARPFVSQQTISAVIDALGSAEGAIAALPVADTLKRGNEMGGIAGTVARDGLWRAQTPQGFRFDTIYAAHRAAPAGSATDDAALLEAAGFHVALVPDDPRNIKLTYREDFELAEAILAGSRQTRTGLGFDVHAFAEGTHVMLGGVAIPHSAGLSGHSDADVALHALTDAILGAICAGDIGQHFPPSDEKWRGAASAQFVGHAMDLLRKAGGQLLHIDLTLICEAPKVGPHRARISERIAEITDIDVGNVSVKATTTEGLGFTGRREGIAAQALVTITLPGGAR